MEYHETEGPITLFTDASQTPPSFLITRIKIGDNHVMKGQTSSKHKTANHSQLVRIESHLLQ